MRVKTALIFLPFLVFLSTQALRAETVIGMAAMGASETQGQDYMGSWVPYLVNLRGINFGGTNNPYNVAIGGATSATLLSPQQQHIKVRNFVEQGKVNIASLSIGGNDYGGNALNLLLGNVNPVTLANTVIANIDTAVDTVLAANPDGMIVWSVPDMSRTATGQQYVVTPQIQAAADAIMDLVNIPLEQEVLSRGLIYIDMAQAMADMESVPLIIGGVVIDTKIASTDPTHLWQNGIHPGSVGNGLFANMAIAALNKGFGTHYALLSDLEILTAAGLASQYTGQTSNLDYAKYVVVPVPEASSILLCFVAFACFIVMYRYRSTRSC